MNEDKAKVDAKGELIACETCGARCTVEKPITLYRLTTGKVVCKACWFKMNEFEEGWE